MRSRLSLLTPSVALFGLVLLAEGVARGERAQPPSAYTAVPLRITPTLAITQRQALLGVAITL